MDLVQGQREEIINCIATVSGQRPESNQERGLGQMKKRDAAPANFIQVNLLIRAMNKVNLLILPSFKNNYSINLPFFMINHMIFYVNNCIF